jgi:hypothetical protein
MIWLLIASFWVWWRYGSLTAAGRWLSGEAILVMPESVELGEVQARVPFPFTVTVRNESSEPLSVHGGGDCCQCRFDSELPISVPIHGERVLKFVLYPNGQPGERMRFPVTIFTSSRYGQPFFHVCALISETRADGGHAMSQSR